MDRRALCLDHASGTGDSERTGMAESSANSSERVGVGPRLGLAWVGMGASGGSTTSKPLSCSRCATLCSASLSSHLFPETDNTEDNQPTPDIRTGSSEW